MGSFRLTFSTLSMTNNRCTQCVLLQLQLCVCCIEEGCTCKYIGRYWGMFVCGGISKLCVLAYAHVYRAIVILSYGNMYNEQVQYTIQCILCELRQLKHLKKKEYCALQVTGQWPLTFDFELTNKRRVLVWSHDYSLLWLVNFQFEWSGVLSSDLQSAVLDFGNWVTQ